MTSSKFHWKIICYFLGISILCISATILAVSYLLDLTNRSDDILGPFLAGWIFATFGVRPSLTTLRLGKKITIDKRNLQIKNLVFKRSKIIPLSEISTYWQYDGHFVRFGAYKGFCFSTTANEIFEFFDFEYSNYDDLVRAISSNVTQHKLDRWQIQKLKLQILVASIIVGLALFGILYFIMKS